VLVVETIAKIRRYHFVEGKKIKEIVRDLGVSRNTVRKVIRSGATEHSYQRQDQPMPRLGGHLERLKGMLEEDWKRPKRRRLTARRLFELLRQEGYEGAYDSVQRYVKAWRQRRGSQVSGTYIPLWFAPGEAYQFDWSHEWAILGGVVQKVKVAHFRLCHSRMFFVAAYPREKQEMVFDAHNRAFAFWGGACRRGIYDNMTTAVDRVLRGKERAFNKGFLRMCSHYLVEPVACTPASGWEKGQVERQVKNVREWLFTPRPRFKDFAELNGWLADRCLEIARQRQHPENKDRTVLEVFEEEKKALIPLATAFDGFVETECRVSSTSLIRHDRNQYSVSCKAAGKTATVRVTAERIQAVHDGEILADHPRQFGRDKTVYDPWHYLDVLETKPGALRNGAPFKDWDLPPAMARVRKILAARPGGDREFVDLLCASRTSGLELMERVCCRAISDGTVRGEIILNLLSREQDPPSAQSVSAPHGLCLHEEPVADCTRYDQLIKEAGHGAA
jgi:transposase